MTGRYRIGSVFDGSYRLLGDGHEVRANVTHRTGRIKLGTESIGGFRNVTVRNTVFHGCRGIALETVDGGILEDIRLSGLTMRDGRNAPIFLRLGARLNAPGRPTPGRLRGVNIRDVVCEQRYTAMPMIISGIPGHLIEDVTMRHIHMTIRGGGTARIARAMPPEAVASYPDPEAFGADLPACGVFARHIKGLTITNFALECARPDERPAVWMQDIDGGRIAVDHARGVRSPSLYARFRAVRGVWARSPNGERADG